MTPQRFTSHQRPDITPQTQAPKGIEQYLADLEQLLKRNTGTGLFVGQDTSSNTPMYLPGTVRDPSGLGSLAPSIAQLGNGMTAPDPVERQAPQQGQAYETQGTQPISAQDFLQKFQESFTANQLPPGGVSPGIDQSQGIASTQDGGVLYRDGSIHYSDGTSRMGDANAYPIASDVSGGIRYSDQSIRQQEPYAIASLGRTPDGRKLVRYSDGSTRYGQYQYQDGQPQPSPGGLQGLVSGIFGQNRPITQAYGNYNPQLEPGGYNTGTDIRTKDLQGSARGYTLPVDAQVVQVLQDDGTRWGDRSGHQGWGNSIVVRLSSGEMLRFSHLSSPTPFQQGQTISSGQVFGTPGQTGNTTGEHLDLMYYTPEGQVANPSQFSGFTNPQGLRTPIPGQEAPGTIISQSTDQPIQQSIDQQPQQPQRSMAQVLSQAMKNVTRDIGSDLAQGVNALNPTGKFGVGITETLQGNPQAAATEQRKTISDVGTALGAPNLQTQALSQEQGTNPFRQLAGNVIDYATTPLKKLGLPDTGLSEAIAGGKTVNTGVNLAPQSYSYDQSGHQIASKNPSPQDYSNVFGTNIADVGKNIQQGVGQALGKAGEGISALAQAGTASLQNVFKPQQVAQKRAVGDVTGTVNASGNPQFSSLMDAAPSMANFAKNDIRDPFFKQGGANIYKDFMKPNAQDISGGALTPDLFTPTFYQDLGRISSVFGGSKDLGQATDKYTQFEKQKYPLMEKMGYADGYEQSGIDDYNRQVDVYNTSINSYINSIGSSVQGVPNSFTPSAPRSAQNVFSGTPSTQQISTPMMGKFSALQPSVNKPVANLSPVVRALAPSMSQSSTLQQAQQQGSSQGTGVPQIQTPQRTVTAPQGSSLRVDSSQKIQSAPKQQVIIPQTKQAVNFSAPVKTQSAQVAPQSKPSNNIFSQVKSFINNVFRKR